MIKSNKDNRIGIGEEIWWEIYSPPPPKKNKKISSKLEL
jgi:hypothetical protein